MQNNYVILYTDEKLNQYILTTSKREHIISFYNLLYKNRADQHNLTFKEVKELFNKKDIKVFNLILQKEYKTYQAYVDLCGFKNCAPIPLWEYVKNRGL